MPERIDWGKRASYIRTRHGVETTWVDEAAGDSGAAWINPDPTSLWPIGSGDRLLAVSERSADRDFATT